MPNLTDAKTSTSPVLGKLAYSINEAAALLSLSPLTVKRLAYKGELKTSKIGSRRVVHAADLERLLKRTQE